MLVRLGAQRHGVNRHRQAIVIEDDDLQQAAGPVGTDVEVTATLTHYADGVADRMLDVLVGNTVLAGVVRDLRERRVTCLCFSCKLPSRPGCPARGRCGRGLL